MRRPSFAVLAALAVVVVVVSWNVVLRHAEKGRSTTRASVAPRATPARPGAAVESAARPRSPGPARRAVVARAPRHIAVRQLADTPFAVRVGAVVHVVDGETQRAPVMAVLPFPLTVTVTDAAGDPLPGVAVHWTLSGGGGRLTADSTATDRAGRMSVRWVLGHRPGVHLVRATVRGGTDAAVFTAVATPDAVPPIYAWR